jgi:hypothetical protein
VDIISDAFLEADKFTKFIQQSEFFLEAMKEIIA